MAATPKPVRKYIKKEQTKTRHELKEDPDLKNRYLHGKKGAMKVAKTSGKGWKEAGKITRKGKLESKTAKMKHEMTRLK